MTEVKNPKIVVHDHAAPRPGEHWLDYDPVTLLMSHCRFCPECKR